MGAQELLSDSPLPLRAPAPALAPGVPSNEAVSRAEFNEMAHQLRTLSEQQQKLVELVEMSYGSLDDRLVSMEVAVQDVNRRFGLG